jgi:hypothetical protein
MSPSPIAPRPVAERVRWHQGRSFTDSRLEDVCPCDVAACGLVEVPSDECDQHGIANLLSASRTIRHSHPADGEMCRAIAALQPHEPGAIGWMQPALDAFRAARRDS